jgi:hypothetical protein
MSRTVKTAPTAPETVKVGSIYQSLNYPHISRKVVRVSKGMVIYSIIDATKPDAQFRKMATGAEIDFLRTSREVS